MQAGQLIDEICEWLTPPGHIPPRGTYPSTFGLAVCDMLSLRMHIGRPYTNGLASTTDYA